MPGGAAQAAPAPGAHKGPLASVFSPIRNVGDNECIQPTAPVANVPVIQLPCNGSTAQGWEFLQVKSNIYKFVNQASGECLWAFGSGTSGAPVGVEDCGNDSNLQFNANSSLPNVVALEARNGFRETNLCVAIPGPAGRTDEVQLQILPCDGSLAQRWVVGF